MFFVQLYLGLEKDISKIIIADIFAKKGGWGNQELSSFEYFLCVFVVFHGYRGFTNNNFLFRRTLMICLIKLYVDSIIYLKSNLDKIFIILGWRVYIEPFDFWKKKYWRGVGIEGGGGDEHRLAIANFWWWPYEIKVI